MPTSQIGIQSYEMQTGCRQGATRGWGPSMRVQWLAVIILCAVSALATAQTTTSPTKTAPATTSPATTAPASQPSAATPVEGKTNNEKWWRGQYEKINAALQKMEGKVDVALVGDSITDRWHGASWAKHWGAYRAVNMGIGGDKTQQVLWRLQNGQLDGYEARLFIVMIGTNNLWGKRADPVDAAAGVKAVIDLIQARQPKANILLLGIFPRDAKPNPGRDRVTATNAIISKYAGGRVHYMDITPVFLEPDGTISKEVMPDFLHLGPKGYDLWAEAIRDKVKELLTDPRTQN